MLLHSDIITNTHTHTHHGDCSIHQCCTGLVGCSMRVCAHNGEQTGACDCLGSNQRHIAHHIHTTTCIVCIHQRQWQHAGAGGHAATSLSFEGGDEHTRECGPRTVPLTLTGRHSGTATAAAPPSRQRGLSSPGNLEEGRVYPGPCGCPG